MKRDNTLAERIATLSPEKRALLEARLKQNNSAKIQLTIPVRQNHAPAPLSFAQQRLWFLDQLEPESSFYNIPNSVRLNGLLDVEALQKALNTIVNRHEILRTTITVVDGSPIQIVQQNRSVSLSTIDLSKSPKLQRQDELHSCLRNEIQRPFDLSRDLMLRATLVRLDSAQHILLLMTHHIASDGWSSGILWQELAALYGAFSRGESNPLPDLPIQYADYAVWQRQWLQGEVLERQLSYWKKQLFGVSALELPTDRSRPAVQTYRGSRQSLELSKELTQRLKALSRKEGLTLFMTLLAAFQTLLYRYSGQEDIAVGSPIAGRTRSETEGLIGFFVNTLVLRADLSGNPSFREVLHRVRQMALDAYEYQDIPFDKLVEELHPDRDLSRSPLFQVMFAFQNVPRQTRELLGLTVSPVEIINETAKFDLSLYTWEEKEGLRARLEYNTDLYDDATISRMLGHFETLLQSIVANPERPIATLPILTEAERHHLLVEWNDTAADFPENATIHQLFEAQVERTPDFAALELAGERVTYRELNQRANHLAYYLQKLSIGPEKFVGVLIERSVDMVVSLLAILKAGGAYVPLDPAYPKERLQFMLSDSNAALLLTQRRFASEIVNYQGKVVFVDPLPAQEFRKGQSPVSGAKAASAMSVIYTSGSTGAPKGVLGLHRAALNRFSWMWKTYPFSPGEKTCQKTSLSFVDSVWEIFGALLQGVPTVIIPDPVAKDPRLLVRELAEWNVTRIVLVPSLLNEIIEQCPDLRKQLVCLKYCFSSGEALSAELAARFRRFLPDCRLINLYGSSEVAADVTCKEISDENGNSGVPIGRPIHNTQIYLLDSHLQPVPLGVYGELYVGGENLSRGYLNRPELTAEKFVPNPFYSDSASRLYKTGDLARYRPDGNIEFLGRLDNQVKIRGCRVELGEIETALRQVPAVRECLVALRDEVVSETGNSISAIQNPKSERSLVVYIVPKLKQSLVVSDLRTFLRQKLPQYMLPSYFVLLDSLPLTPNGKIDRRALPAPDVSSLTLEKTFVAPRDDQERELAELWEKTLLVRPVSVKDNFFDLGGHSLLAVRLMSQIEKALGKKLPVAALFQAPTVEQLAKLLKPDVASASWSRLVPLQSKGSKPPFFWIHGEDTDAFLPRYLEPDQPVYGFRHQSEDGQPALCTTVPTIAAHYLSEIRTVQPRGPYFLGGYCFGGMVAFEIAQQLIEKLKEPVSLLFMLDPAVPRIDKSVAHFRVDSLKISAKESTFGWFLRHLRRIKTLELNARLTYVSERATMKIADLAWNIISPAKRLAQKFACEAYVRVGRPLPVSLRSCYILSVYSKAITSYIPTVYPARLIVFKATSEPRHVERWESFAAQGLEIHELTGDHSTILKEEHARVWGVSLKAHLEQAQAGTQLSPAILTPTTRLAGVAR